jgi:hypothetical protein
VAGTIPIKPYTEGFIPLAAAMVLSLFSDRKGLPEVVDDFISVTNFVKFSTADDASSSSIPTIWWRECAARYVVEEVAELQPEVILAFGQKTHRELLKTLAKLPHSGRAAIVLPCRFPGRIASERARPLSAREAEIWLQHVRPLAQRLRPPPADAYHKWRMLRFPAYFVELLFAWQRESLPERVTRLAHKWTSPNS